MVVLFLEIGAWWSEVMQGHFFYQVLGKIFFLEVSAAPTAFHCSIKDSGEKYVTFLSLFLLVTAMTLYKILSSCRPLCNWSSSTTGSIILFLKPYISLLAFCNSEISIF